MDGAINYIPLQNIVFSDLRPNLEFQTDSLENLKKSIKKMGIIEPLIVRKKDDKFEIIIGNRRYKAAQELNLEKVPAIIVDVNDEQALSMIITNNIQRKDLTSKEEAELYEKALSYPNVNIDQLGLDLGIPIERIKSKLKIIKKKPTKSNQIYEQIKENKENPENPPKNNTVNNDIISLTELNKDQIRRESVNMNENQFMPNNMSAETPTNQEPTFGGRFFPSSDEQLENQSNNMPNPMMGGVEQPTDVNPPMDNPQPEPMPIPNIEQPAETPGLDISNLNGIPTFNNNIEPTPAPEVPELNNIPDLSIPTPAPQPVEGNPEANIPAPAPSVGIPISPLPNVDLNTPIEPTNNIEIPQVTGEPTLNGIPSFNSPVEASSSKDVTPIVNIIKSITENMELLGYKLKVTETDNPDNYQINIEVEK